MAEEVILRFWSRESREAFLGQLSDGWGEGFMEFDPLTTGHKGPIICEVRCFYDPSVQNPSEADDYYNDEWWNHPGLERP